MLNVSVLTFVMTMVFVRIMHTIARAHAHEYVLPQPLLGLAHGLGVRAWQVFLQAHCKFAIAFAKLMRTGIAIRLSSFAGN